jgi:hypothetical protein
MGIGRIRTVPDEISAFIPTRTAAVVCFGVALGVFGIESVAWPLSGGRDWSNYLIYYADMWHSQPAFPALMLFRTPIAPLLYGPFLQLGGPALAEAVMGVAYAGSVVAFAAAALVFGRVAAVVTALALLAYPGYGALFHQVSSDPVFAFVYALWTLGMIRTLRRPTTMRFALLGAGVLALVLARPGAQVFLLFVLVPLLVSTSWRSRILWAGTFFAAAIGGLALWASYNDLRYGDFVVARAGWANVPFYRVFVMDKLVRAENGPASRQLADAIDRDLLTKKPYPEIHITTADQFFRIGSDHMWSDVVYLTDREWGWASDYAILRRVSIEAIRHHFRLYARDVAASTWEELRTPYQWAAPQVAGSKPPAPSTAHPASASSPSATAAAADPGGRYWWLASTPDGKPPVQSRVNRMVRSETKLAAHIPDRSGSASVAAALNAISRWYPWAAIWLAVGLAGVALRRPRGSLTLIATAGLAVIMIAFTELGEPPGLAYGLPLVPGLVLCGVAAWTAPGRRVLGLLANGSRQSRRNSAWAPRRARR